MKTSSAELKRTARENLSGKYGVAMLAMITVSLIPSAFYSILLQITPVTAVHHKKTIYYLASIIITVLQLILTCGQLRLHLNIATRQPYQFSDIFFSFRAHPQKIVGAYTASNAVYDSGCFTGRYSACLGSVAVCKFSSNYRAGSHCSISRYDY